MIETSFISTATDTSPCQIQFMNLKNCLTTMQNTLNTMQSDIDYIKENGGGGGGSIGGVLGTFNNNSWQIIRQVLDNKETNKYFKSSDATIVKALSYTLNITRVQFVYYYSSNGNSGRIDLYKLGNDYTTGLDNMSTSMPNSSITPSVTISPQGIDFTYNTVRVAQYILGPSLTGDETWSGYTLTADISNQKYTDSVGAVTSISSYLSIDLSNVTFYAQRRSNDNTRSDLYANNIVVKLR